MDFQTFTTFTNLTTPSQNATLHLFPLTSFTSPPPQASNPSLVTFPLSPEERIQLHNWKGRDFNELAGPLGRKVALVLSELWIASMEKLPENVKEVRIMPRIAEGWTTGWFRELEGMVVERMREAIPREGVEVVVLEKL